MTAVEIIDGFCLERTFQISGNKVFPNTHLHRNEADIFEVTKSGYLYEYEVKVSRADFFAEKKKVGKADRLLSGERCNYFYYLVPEGLIQPEEVPEYAGLMYVRGIYHTATRKMGVFYDDPPTWMEPRLSVTTVKSAPKLTPDKMGDKHISKLLESTYRRFHARIRDKYKQNIEL